MTKYPVGAILSTIETMRTRQMCPSNPPEILLVQTTCPNKESAQVLAKKLLAQGLAACVNIIDGVESHYRWEGEYRQGQEALMLIKAPAATYSQLEMV